MPNWSNIGHSLLGHLATGIVDYDGKKYAEGFDDAAIICLNHLEEEIQRLYAQLKAGKKLTAQEQFLSVSLGKLKSDMEQSLRNHFTPEPEESEKSEPSSIRN